MLLCLYAEETMNLLRKLAERADVQGLAKKMFQGEKINNTEKRAVLHIALRNKSFGPIMVDGEDVMKDVNAVLVCCRKKQNLAFSHCG